MGETSPTRSPLASDAVRKCVTTASGFETSPPGLTQVSLHTHSVVGLFRERD